MSEHLDNLENFVNGLPEFFKMVEKVFIEQIERIAQDVMIESSQYIERRDDG